MGQTAALCHVSHQPQHKKVHSSSIWRNIASVLFLTGQSGHPVHSSATNIFSSSFRTLVGRSRIDSQIATVSQIPRVKPIRKNCHSVLIYYPLPLTPAPLPAPRGNAPPFPDTPGRRFSRRRRYRAGDPA